METVKAILENRKAVLKGYIASDKTLFNDPFLSQHSRGKVAVEEKWLDETERLLELIEKRGE